ncbi:DapH/DapD/GlmU-related protein [Halorubrum miltondacostae]|uniref:DapH/DapD/GlmU-related protein n=1 Tax=Halorubrum miltondacostae TaxID=3076378 RepID=A0ABD5MA30_9EURY
MIDPIIIEEGVWIGPSSTILKGVTTGRGSVIASNSVVTKDILYTLLLLVNPRASSTMISTGRASLSTIILYVINILN